MTLSENLRALFAEDKSLSVVEQMEWDGEWVPPPSWKRWASSPRMG